MYMHMYVLCCVVLCCVVLCCVVLCCVVLCCVVLCCVVMIPKISFLSSTLLCYTNFILSSLFCKFEKRHITPCKTPCPPWLKNQFYHGFLKIDFRGGVGTEITCKTCPTPYSPHPAPCAIIKI